MVLAFLPRPQSKAGFSGLALHGNHLCGLAAIPGTERLNQASWWGSQDKKGFKKLFLRLIDHRIYANKQMVKGGEEESAGVGKLCVAICSYQ